MDGGAATKAALGRGLVLVALLRRGANRREADHAVVAGVADAHRKGKV